MKQFIVTTPLVFLFAFLLHGQDYCSALLQQVLPAETADYRVVKEAAAIPRNDIETFRMIGMADSLLPSTAFQKLLKAAQEPPLVRWEQSLLPVSNWIDEKVIATYIKLPHPGYHIYQFYQPVFTPNQQYALLAYETYCGFSCRTHTMRLYKRDQKRWKKIRDIVYNEL